MPVAQDVVFHVERDGGLTPPVVGYVFGARERFSWAERLFGGWVCRCEEREEPRSLRGGDGVSVGEVVVEPLGGLGLMLRVWVRVVGGELEAFAPAQNTVKWREPRMRRRLSAVALEHWKGCERKGSGGFHDMLKGVVR